MTAPKPKLKHCPRCNKDVPVVHFYKDSRSSDGLRYSCKECEAARRNGHRKNQTTTKKQRVKYEDEARRMRQEANRNALLALMKRHIDEFDQLYSMEIRRLKAQAGDPEAEKLWISLG